MRGLRGNRKKLDVCSPKTRFCGNRDFQKNYKVSQNIITFQPTPPPWRFWAFLRGDLDGMNFSFVDPKPKGVCVCVRELD